MEEKKSLMEWQEICDGWAKSGLTQSKYCAQKAISVGSFKMQLYALRSKRKKEPIFSKVYVSEEKTFAPYCTLQFQNGEKVIIETEFGMTILKQLLSVK